MVLNEAAAAGLPLVATEVVGGGYDLIEPGVNGYRVPADDADALRYAVTPRYLETMEIPIRSGRGFTDADNARAPSVALVNEAAASTLFPGGNAIGKRVRVGGSRPAATIVGVVGNTVHRSMDAGHELQVYVPSSQWGEEGGMTLVVHTTVRPENAGAPVRSAIRRVVPGIAISKVATLERLLDISTADRRFALALFAAFAGVALLLATAGLYGVLAATVVERTREIGVRTALGAPRGRILALVMRQGMGLTGLGLAIGLFATWGSTRVISTLLFGVGASDPIVLAVVTFTLGVAALLACALPAWRASRVDPVIALRES
jgi:predicted permease